MCTFPVHMQILYRRTCVCLRHMQHTHACTHMHTHAHTRMHTHAHTRMHTHAHTRIAATVSLASPCQAQVGQGVGKRWICHILRNEILHTLHCEATVIRLTTEKLHNGRCILRSHTSPTFMNHVLCCVLRCTTHPSYIWSEAVQSGINVVPYRSDCVSHH